MDEKGEKIEDGKIFLSFTDRTLDNKFFRIIYKIYRIFYVSVWFYFLPFIALLGSYYLPYLMKVHYK